MLLYFVYILLKIGVVKAGDSNLGKSKESIALEKKLKIFT